MLRFITILSIGVGLSLALAGCSSSPFSAPPMRAAPVSNTSNPYAIQGIPQSQYECVTDEGYGRFTPCGTMN